MCSCKFVGVCVRARDRFDGSVRRVGPGTFLYLCTFLFVCFLFYLVKK